MTPPVQVVLTRGFVASVDSKNSDLAELRWHAVSEDSVIAYAARNVTPSGGRRNYQFMHRVVLERLLGRNLASHEHVDHIDGNTLNNLETNLRLATRHENARNCRIPRTNTSGYKGVSWDPKRERFSSYIWVNNRKKHLGRFVDIIDAAIAYDLASIELHGAFASPNYPRAAYVRGDW